MSPTITSGMLEFFLAFALSSLLHSTSDISSRHSARPGLWQALFVNALTIAVCQAGMYLAMAAVVDLWLMPRYGGMEGAAQPEHWFVMQVAMAFGYAVTLPVNFVLMRGRGGFWSAASRA